MPKTKQAIRSAVQRDAASRGVTLTPNQTKALVNKRSEQSRVDSSLNPRGTSRQMAGRGNFWSKAYNWAQEKIPKGTMAGIGDATGIPGMGLLGGALAKATGIGDYTIRKNSIINDDSPDKHFSFSDFGGARVRIKKREYIGPILTDAVSPAAFKQYNFRLQVTDPTTFPWAHKIGELFTEWQLIGGVMSFETTSSNYTTNLALGSIAIATQYNSNTLPYGDMDSILQSAYHTRGNPSENLLHGIECDPELQASERLYTRRPGAAGPPNLYDHGVVTVATEGLPATATGVVLGRLYWTYDIEVSLPELAVQAPFENRVASTSGATTNILPPLGPSTTLVASSSDLTVGSVAGDNVLLLTGTSGPSVQPAMSPAQTNALMCWFNDSTLVVTEQYLTFARAGFYYLGVDMVNGAGVDPTAVPLTIVDLSTNVSVFGSNFPVNATPAFARRVWYTLEVKTANTGFLLQNATPAGSYSAYAKIYAC